MSFSKVLIANRGAIACRVIRTLDRLGIASVAVYSDADAGSLHVERAGESVRLGPGPAAESYLRGDLIIEAALSTGAQAIHPGYGFLSENPEFAEACAAAGLTFIGPRPAHMRAFGLKHEARAIAEREGAPLLPGTGLLSSAAEALDAASRIGYPVILKSTAGGGGIGMRLCRNAAELELGFAAVAHLGSANFKNSALYLERYVERARHIEVQIFGDGRGEVLALGERDCSLQRRHQKVLEETPAPHLRPDLRSRLFETAIRLTASVAYENAGTVEFLFDDERQEFYFLEVNTRLQVEHGVTEEVTGLDLVEWMIRQSAGDLPPLATLAPTSAGASIQVRLYAEDPNRAFQPFPGELTQVRWPHGVRVETWVETGATIPPFYDPMIAKVIAWGETREEAAFRLEAALKETSLEGVTTNLEYLRQVAASPEFRHGQVSTKFLETFTYQSRSIEVLDGGTQTTVQDYPGRLGYWDIGVPPSGPMDSLSFRLVNRLVGNAPSAAGLECTLLGASLKFHSPTVIALGGADMTATLDDTPLPRWTPVPVPAGSILRLGAVSGPGARAYLAIRGGLDTTPYLDSRSTFILGRFGGHAGRTLRAGDVLRLGSESSADPAAKPLSHPPSWTHDWRIAVLYGPHGEPDFFTRDGVEAFFESTWRVHHHSDRTGVRLIGPKPQFARPDGGDAGLHPSNLHDNAYAVGALDITGDTPILLGPDGPSLGGFVCPCVVLSADRWKLGQLKAGDTVRFVPVTADQAVAYERAVESYVAGRALGLPPLPAATTERQAIVHTSASTVTRPSGDRYFLWEFGPNELDLELRFRVQASYEWLRKQQPRGLVDLTPGVRSLQIHFDSARASREDVLSWIRGAEEAVEHLDDIEVPSRTVHLPLSWDDPSTRIAIEKYMQTVRPDAPWCPSNIEFIRRINGLDSLDDVHRIVFDARYLVLGLGDVYLGAPVATPIDPRHRLVTTKYNPARTWTPENAVGIGGSYLCIYGMEGPGGYQFVGRTLQTWNRYRKTREFAEPWLLRFFDQIRFHPVSATDLLEMREAFPRGRHSISIEDGRFRLSDYRRFLSGIAPEVRAFREKRQAAFHEERERWRQTGADYTVIALDEDAPAAAEAEIPEGCLAVRAPITASVWQTPSAPGQHVQAAQHLIVLEAMKMEVAVSAPASGELLELFCAPGALVQAGQLLAILRPNGRPH